MDDMTESKWIAGSRTVMGNFARARTGTTAALVTCLSTLILAPVRVPGAEASRASAAEDKTDFKVIISQGAAGYTLHLDLDPPVRLASPPICVLRWANVPRGSHDAMSFIWTAQGRPQAALSVIVWGTSVSKVQVQHEFQSLSRHGIVARRDGRRVWNPATAGVEIRPVPDAPPPAETAAARLRQMKMLARRFSSTLQGWYGGDLRREELRMLPRPLYRYEGKHADLLDGTLFAFVAGTDPEVLLMLEAARADSHYRWRYALAKTCSGVLEVRYQNKAVWRAPKAPNGAKHPYYHFAPRMDSR